MCSSDLAATMYAPGSGGFATVTRTAEGTWTITWDFSLPGTLPNGGSAYVSPLGKAPRFCSVSSWNASTSKISINVWCRDIESAYADTRFIVAWTEHPSPYTTYEGKQSGYAWMNLANTSGTPNAGYQATSSGDAITSTRTDTGRYTVTIDRKSTRLNSSH